MMVDFFRDFICFQERSEADRAVDAEFELCRNELELAGLSEEELRNMDPDDRVAALEQAQLDPYDYIYLACG
jgi:hypothetical protein